MGCGEVVRVTGSESQLSYEDDEQDELYEDSRNEGAGLLVIGAGGGADD